MTAASKPRRKHSLDFKLRAIALADEIGNGAAAKQLGIHNSLPRQWKVALAKNGASAKSHRTKSRLVTKRSGPILNSPFPELPSVSDSRLEAYRQGLHDGIALLRSFLQEGDKE